MQQDRYLFYRSPAKEYPVIVKAEGVYLYDEAGKRYLDACAGSLVANIGHAVPEVARALYEQATSVAFVHGSRWTTQPLRELAQRLAALTPGNLARTFFVNSGSEAVEAAAKMARQYFIERDGANSPKRKVVGRWLGYHGVTIGALSYGGHLARRSHFVPLLAEHPHAQPCYCYRCPYDLQYPACQVKCATAVEALILAEGPETISAFIAEPVVGATIGAVPAVDEYFRIIRDLCDKYDILFIADEVMTGFGRTGKNFGIDHYGVVPDMMVVAKGIGAGYAPIGAVITTEAIWQTFRDGSGQFVHGNTYGGNPLGAAVSLAVLDYTQKHRLIERAAALEPRFIGGLQTLRKHAIVGDVRGKGLMAGIELVQDRETREPFPARLGVAERVTQAAMRRGVVLYPGQGSVGGKAGDHLLIGPPLTVTEGQIADLIEGLDGALAEVATVIEQEGIANA